MWLALFIPGEPSRVATSPPGWIAAIAASFLGSCRPQMSKTTPCASGSARK